MSYEQIAQAERDKGNKDVTRDSVISAIKRKGRKKRRR
jgi:hypothetical protein